MENETQTGGKKVSYKLSNLQVTHVLRVLLYMIEWLCGLSILYLDRRTLTLVSIAWSTPSCS